MTAKNLNFIVSKCKINAGIELLFLTSRILKENSTFFCLLLEKEDDMRTRTGYSFTYLKWKNCSSQDTHKYIFHFQIN